MRAILTAPIRAYQRALSPMLGRRCRYHPSCSAYAIEAIREFGALRGTVLAGWRLLRCNPWSQGGVDHPRDQRVFPGVNPLNLLEDPLRGLLDFLHENVNLTYGWSIVILTVIVRLCLLPLVVKQYASMRRMQAVAPQLKELQQKYKGNRAKLNEELMAFYKEKEINPFSSCLPLVAQLPVFIALYYVLREFAKDATVNTGAVSFMWVVPDVREQLTDIGWGAGVIVAIYALSQLLSTELSATPNMPASQRRIMRVLPVVVVLFVFQFPVPSGLVIYWMTTNLWTAGQQLVMRHRIGLHLADPAEAPPPARKGSRTPPRAEPAGVAALAEGPSEDMAAADDAPVGPRPTPRKRRRWRAEEGPAAIGDGGGDAPVQTEPEAVREEPAAEAPPEPLEAPEALDAPEPPEVPEPDQAPEPQAAPEATAPAERSGSGTTRRRPPPKGPTRPARPASATRSKKKKRKR